MSVSKDLSSNPNFAQLKKQAKDLLKAAKANAPEALERFKKFHPKIEAFDSLNQAQLAIAREYGFPSWAKLKVHVESLAQTLKELRKDFIIAAVSNNISKAKQLLAENPQLTNDCFFIALILGDFDFVKQKINFDPENVHKKTGPLNQEPLLYLSRSYFHQVDKKYAAGILKCADLLFDNGADPNIYVKEDPWPDAPLRPLYFASSETNNSALVRRILEAGAMTDDGESTYHAAQNFHLENLELLKEFGADFSTPHEQWGNSPIYFNMGMSWIDKSWSKTKKGIHWLLENGADPNALCTDNQETALHLAARIGQELEIVELLLNHGADVNILTKDGYSALKYALLFGNAHIADLLKKDIAENVELTMQEELMAACSAEDTKKVAELLKANPELSLIDFPHTKELLFVCVDRCKTTALELLLNSGLDVATTREGGTTLLHQAAWHGQVDVVNLLLKFKPPLNQECKDFQAPPIGWAQEGSIRCLNPKGDYPKVVKILLDQGAKPKHLYGSDAVLEVFNSHILKNKKTLL